MEYIIESVASKVAAHRDSLGSKSTFEDAWAGVTNMITMRLFASAQIYLVIVCFLYLLQNL